MVLGDVIDELHDDDGLAHARATEKSDLAALQEWLDKINDLHSGLEHLRRCRLIFEQRRSAMDRVPFFRGDWAEVVHRLADHVHDASQRAMANGG